MPHARLTGTLDYDKLWREPPAFSFSIPEEDTHIKFREVFLAGSRPAVLLRYAVTEGRLTQHLQLLVIREVEGEGNLVKIDRGCPVLRTAGVKLLIAAVTRYLLQHQPLELYSETVAHFADRGSFWASHGIPATRGAEAGIDEE